MKNLIVLTLLAACAMLILPGVVSAQCFMAPWSDPGCGGGNCDDSGRLWCEGPFLCMAEPWCVDGAHCEGWDRDYCANYCYCPGGEDSGTCGCYDTAKVDLLDFAAERVDEGVKLTWKTGQEIECGAFKLLRCETGDKATCELWEHTELSITVPCEDNPNGADYMTVDTTTKKDQSYSYYLREYDTTARIFEYGPLFMSIDDSIMNTGHVEPFESTFEILTAPSNDDDDEEEEDAEEEPEAGADESDDSEGGCGC
jgi:hypothetical protein